MSELDLHQLRVFVAVSRHGSVAKAAAALRLTASPVSRTLRELERMTGALFERGYHDMRPTAQGRHLLPVAAGIVRQADDLLLLAKGEEPPLRWSATPWVPERFADAVRAAAPHGAIEVEGAVSSVLLHRMTHGEVDVAVVHLPVSAPGIATTPIARYRFTLAVADEDPLADRTTVAPEDLRGRRVLMLPIAMQPAAMAGLHAWVRSTGAESVEEVSLADAMLLGGRLRRESAVTLGVAEADAVVPRGHGIRRIPFATDPVEFLMGIAWRDEDPIRRERIARLVAAVQPAGAPLIVVG